MVGLAPSEAVTLGVEETLGLLRARYGTSVDLALAAASRPWAGLDEPTRRVIASPVADERDAKWLTRANIVGVNLRTLTDVWSLVPYTLTVPAIQSAIHLLPVLEPGVVSSLYAPASWNVDPALFSERLATVAPRLDTAEAQLRAVVHLLHVAGRTVGVDVIPHCDRFAEIVLAQPDHFEWLERHGARVVRHGPSVVGDVQAQILRWLSRRGPAVPGDTPPGADEFFRRQPEAQRLLALFGTPDDHEGRQARRIALIRDLHTSGFETVPATMAPPYRGLEADPDPAAVRIDAIGLEWREFRFTEPGTASRVFGPLTRYDLYEPASTYSERDTSTAAWALDTTRPRRRVWQYVAESWAELVDRFGFDFMRGDMAHVQIRPGGVPTRVDPEYDILGFVRHYIATTRTRPSFGYFAETFLAPPGAMAFGDELDHLEAAGADATLGDLQSVATSDPVFVRRLRRYRDVLATRSVTPSFTMFTADKDDPRFDDVYMVGNELRMLLGLFLPDMPSYMGLGFEQRDPHPVPAPNEHYTKLYVFHQTSGANATRGPYVWGANWPLLERLTQLRMFADGIRRDLDGARVTWLRPPDATGEERLLAWVLEGRGTLRLVLVNLDTARLSVRLGVPIAALRTLGTRIPESWQVEFSTKGRTQPEYLPWNGRHWVVSDLAAEEGRIFKAHDHVRPAG